MLQLTRIITLVLVLRHSIGNRSKMKRFTYFTVLFWSLNYASPANQITKFLLEQVYAYTIEKRKCFVCLLI